MAEPAIQRPGHAEALDWRAGRTWAAYLGSAAIIGILTSAVPLALSIWFQARSSGPVLEDGEGRSVAGTLLLLGLLVACALIAFFAKREQQAFDAPGGGARRDTVPTETWPSLKHFIAWSAALGLTLLTLFYGVFDHVTPKSLGILLSASVGYASSLALVPDFMRRWGRAKAKPGG